MSESWQCLNCRGWNNGPTCVCGVQRGDGVRALQVLKPCAKDKEAMIAVLGEAIDGVSAGRYKSIVVLGETAEGCDQLRSRCHDRYKLIGLLSQVIADMHIDIRQECGEPEPITPAPRETG